MKNRSSWKKRLLALALAATTVVSSFSFDWSSLKAEAASGGTLVMTTNQVQSGGKIAQVIQRDNTITSGTLQKLKSVSMMLHIGAGETVSVGVKFYQNAGSISNYEEAPVVYGEKTYTNSSTAGEDKIITIFDGTTGVYLAENEALYAVATITTSGTSDALVEYGTDTTGGSGYVYVNPDYGWMSSADTMTFTWDDSYGTQNQADTNTSGVTGIQTSLTGDSATATSLNYAMQKGASVDLSAVLSPAYSRVISYNSSKTAVATVSSDGIVTAVGTGSSDITIKAGTFTKTIHLYVLDVALSESSFAYSGYDQKPTVTVTGTATENAGAASDTLTENTNYTVAYASDTVNVNNAVELTVTGAGVLSTFSYSDTYSIGTYNLNNSSDKTAINSYVSTNKPFTIDMSSDSVTAGEDMAVSLNDGKVHTLVYGTDYTVTSISRSTVGTKSVTYALSLKGKGNYTGTVTVYQQVVASASAKLDLSAIATLDVDTASFTYNGAEQTPGVEFYDRVSGTAITDFVADVDYQVVYTEVGGTAAVEPTDAGDYTVTVVGIGSYTGSISADFSIDPLSIKNNATVTLASTNYIYTGSAIEPTVSSVKCTSLNRTLTKNTDYTISYSNNINTGNGVVTITGTGNYTGTYTTGFTIVGVFDDAKIYIDGTSSGSAVNVGGTAKKTYSFTGSAIEPVVKKVEIDSATLPTTDYTVTYSENINAGTGVITITGAGTYADLNQSVSVYFTITPKSIENGNGILTVNDITKTYNGSAQTLTAGTASGEGEYTLSVGSEYLAEGTDFDVEYEDNTNAGEATMTVTAKGNYTGTLSANFTINRLDISSSASGVSTTLSETSFSFTGSAVTPDVVVALADGTPISADAGYEVYYANNTKVAASNASLPPTVTVKGTGNLYGTVKLYFEITPSSGQTLSFTLEGLDYGTALTNQTTTLDGSATMAFTGSATYARISVKNGDTPLISGTDYTISYSNNVNVTTKDVDGSILKPTVTITGQGNYANTVVNLTYSITRKDISNFVVEEADANSDGIPEFVVKASSTTAALTESTDGGTTGDYTVTYDDNSTVGAKTATITGVNNYEGTITKNYSIGKDIADASNGFKIQYTYANIDTSGTAVEVHNTTAAISNASDNIITFDTLYMGLTGRPIIKLLQSDGTEVNSSFYTITYDSTARRVGNTVTATVSVTPNLSITDYTDAIYSSRTLTVKYTISAFNTSSLAVTAKKLFLKPLDAAYVSTETATTSSTFETAYYTYTGGEIIPYKTMSFNPAAYNSISPGLTVVVFDGAGTGEETLTAGTDYTVTTADGTTIGPEASTAVENLTIAMTNTNITGTHRRTAWVNAADPGDISICAGTTTTDIRSSIEYDSINLVFPNGYKKDYTGSEITPFGSDLSLYYGTGANRKKLGLDTDYTVEYYDGSSATATVTPSNVTTLTKAAPINSGVWYVVITLSSNFGNSKIYGSFVINKKTLAGATVYIWNTDTSTYASSTFTSYNYDATVKKPVANDQGLNGFIVKDRDGKLLTYGTDYTVEYGVADANYGDDFKLPGKYSVTITGTGSGNYASTAELATSFTSLSYKIIGDISNTTLFGFYEGVSASDPYVSGKNYTIDKNAQGVFTSEFDPSAMYLSVNDTGANSLVKYQYNKGFIIYGLDNLTTPGEVTLSFAGDGDYYTGMRYYTVYSYGDIADAEVTGLNDTYTYTGRAINPTGISISYNGVSLTKNTHYTTALSNNTDIGTASLTITGLGYFTAGSGSVIKGFNIKYDISKMTLSASDAQTYNYGNPVYLPDTTYIRYALSGADAKTWKLSDMATNAATPFKATYSNNTEAGTAEITLSVTDSDKAFGSMVFTYTIAPVQFTASDMTVTLSDASSTYTYTGEEIQPAIASVKIGTTVLQEDVDYYVTYANNINSALATADTAPTIYINGYGNYSGSVTKTFTIAPVDLASVGVINLTPADGNLPYSGGTGMLPTYEVTATVNSNTRTLTEGSDFTVTNSPLVTVPGDTGTITVQGNGNYTGSISSATYTVTKCALSSASITKAAQEAEYTGNAITPSLAVTVTFADVTKTLTEGTDYEVSYGGASMVNAGAYTITISAPASSAYYEGSTTTTFTINPKDLGAEGGMQVDGTVITISKTDDGDDFVDDEYEVSAVDTQDWNDGNQVMPELLIKDVSNDNPEHNNTPNYKTLVKDQDYTIEWTNNRDAATNDPNNAAYDENAVPTITVTGKGNYKGTFTKTFTIGKDLADATKYEPLLSEYSYIYNGSSQVPTVTVNNLTTTPTSTLVEGDDFSVVAPADSINAQESIELEIQGENAFYGKLSQTYSIQKKTIDPSALVILPDSSLTKTYDDDGTIYSYFESDTAGYYYWATVYNGSAMRPTFNVYDTEISSTLPIATSSYTVSYTNNTNAGGVKSPATAQITLGGNYNTYSATPFKFVILPYDGGITLTLSANEMAYTGRTLTPGYTVTNASGQTLTEGMDYTITFSNNKNAGTASVQVTGINNYINNDASTTFTIYANLTEDCVTITDQLYTGSAINPELKVVCGGNTLVLGTDYQITSSGSDNDYVSSGYVIVDSLQPTYYRNTPVTVTYNIVFGSDYLNVSGVADQYTYSGEAIKPSITVKDNNDNVLAATVTYNSSSDGNTCVNVGTVTYKATVSVAGKSLVKTGTYKIVKRNVNTCTFGSLSNDTYTGSSLKPPVSVTYLGENLKKGSSGDYTITYSNNKNPGTAKVTIKGVNNYSGTRTMYFTISIGKVINLKAKGASNKKLKLTWTKVNHATGYVVTYKVGSKTYSKTVKTNSYTITGLKQSKKYQVSVKAYKTIGTKKYYGTSSSVTGKTLVATPEITLSSNKAKQVTVSWKKNTSATGYTVYRSNKKDSGFVKVADVPSKKSSWTNKKLSSNKTYYYYIKAYQLVNGKKVYGAKSSVKSIKVK